MAQLEIVFGIICLLAVIGLYLATNKQWEVVLTFLVWAAISGFLAKTGFFENTERLPPPFLYFILPTIVFCVFVYRSPKTLNLKWLIAINLLRIPVELVLFGLFGQDLVPKTLTFEGWNFDILSGVSAIFILILHLNNLLPIKILKIWNGLSFCLLLAIILMAVLSAPSPFQLLAFEQPNLAVLKFPFIWLPTVVIPIVLLSHLWIFKLIKNCDKWLIAFS